MTSTCPAQTGPVWKLGGEPCGCVLPADHIDRSADELINGICVRDHQCSCGAWWVDEIRRDNNPHP